MAAAPEVAGLSSSQQPAAAAAGDNGSSPEEREGQLRPRMAARLNVHDGSSGHEEGMSALERAGTGEGTRERGVAAHMVWLHHNPVAPLQNKAVRRSCGTKSPQALTTTAQWHCTSCSLPMGLRWISNGV